MATRLYLPSTGPTPDITPGFAAYTETTSMARLEMSPHKRASAMTSVTAAMVATAANSSRGVRQYISPPMRAQTISAGTWKGTVRMLESAVNDNADAVRASLRYWDLSANALGGTALVALANGTVLEFATTLTAKRIAAGAATTSVTVEDGDRLVLDLGYVTTVGGTSISADMNFGDNSATDLGDNETDTAANNPFIELSVDIQWYSPDPPDIGYFRRFLVQ